MNWGHHMKASKQQIMAAFEADTKDWELDYTKQYRDTFDEGIAYEDYATGIMFGSYIMGYQACEARDPTNAWLKTRGHK